MDKTLLELIRKYLSNSCTEEERTAVENWYRSFETKDDFLDMLSAADRQLLENKMLGSIHERIAELENSQVSSPVVPPLRAVRNRKILLRIAAVFLLGVVITGLLYYVTGLQHVKVYKAAYGEKSKVVLPDGSEVMLNGNSTIKTGGDWDKSAREVWLSGEAFFSVKHTVGSKAFLVHTANGVTVEVLGTAFNVKSRTSGTQVVLQTGKVRLNVAGKNGTDTLTMKPGEIVEVAASSKEQARIIVHPNKYISWQEQKMVFFNTPVQDIIRMIQETYGYDVIIKDPSILAVEVNGTIPNNNIDVLLKALEESFALKISKEGNTLTIAGGK